MGEVALHEDTNTAGQDILRQKKVFTQEKSSTPTVLAWDANMAAVSLFWDTNMAPWRHMKRLFSNFQNLLGGGTRGIMGDVQSLFGL